MTGANAFIPVIVPQNQRSNSDFDSDALAFLTAAAITDPTQRTAINDFVVSAKDHGYWTGLRAIYPFVGGTAGSHKWNLKDPRDLDAAYRITWVGTVTHNANGITGDGATGYGNTHYTPSTAGDTSSSASAGLYTRTAANTVYDYSASGQDGVLPSFGGVFYVALGHGFQFVAAPGTGGVFAVNRTATNTEGWYNGTKVIDNAVASTPSAFERLLLATNGGAPSGFSAANLAFAYSGASLTNQQNIDLHADILALQVALGRDV